MRYSAAYMPVGGCAGLTTWLISLRRWVFGRPGECGAREAVAA